MTQTLQTPSLSQNQIQIRLTFLRWLAIYPTITLVLELTGPYVFGKLPTFLTALIATLLVVPTVHYLLIPLFRTLFQNWVTIPQLPQKAHHKMAFVLWLGTYPVITALLYLLLPVLFGHVALPVVTLIITLIAVPLVNFQVVPRLVKGMKNWIFAK
ncbi:hypothetical protein [Deinococcus roseus]|uniref:Uncharacterized protein n=1 Tax=Deinococcus roseus TaxID=392414 RepID=A0ABQ2D1K4_9DEIO|nr:hypothetical protein [Deinococcus roseus]GGJ37412.1 hypothetical protein GCM10008938_24420 [Deinococcus roseus]